MNPKSISPCEISSFDCEEAPYLKIEVEDDVFEQYIVTQIPKDLDHQLKPHNPVQSPDDILESNTGQASLSYSSRKAGHHNRHRGQQDTRPEIRAISHQEAYRLIMKRAVMYLSRREYTQHTLKTKLSKAFETLTIKTTNEAHFATEDPADMHTMHTMYTDNHLGLNAQVSELIESVMSYLAQHNWQSDQRCAEHISQVKGQRYGSNRVKHLLAQEGVDKSLIEQTVQNLNQTERQRAVSVWRKKFGVQPKNAADYAKQVRFMAYRGFSFELINQILKANEDTLSDWDECDD